MTVPMNKQDFSRFTKLTDALRSNPEKSEISIYISSSTDSNLKYVHLELRGYLSQEQIAELYK